MGFAGFLIIAFAPGVFWLWFFARKDIYHPAPKRLLALTFFLGMLSTIPVSIAYVFLLDESMFTNDAPLASTAMAMLFVVGPVEELFKFAAVRILAYRSPYFEEPLDGMVYAAAASLGFASLENLMYVLSFGPAVMILRAPMSTLAHVVFGSAWGYALGLQKRRQAFGLHLVLAGVTAGAIAHGLFNISTLVFLPIAVGLLVVGVIWTLSRFDWAQRVSPFRYKRNYPKIACPSCHRQIRVTSRFCRSCGLPTQGIDGTTLFCGYCGKANHSDASYCTQCGDRLLRTL